MVSMHFEVYEDNFFEKKETNNGGKVMAKAHMHMS